MAPEPVSGDSIVDPVTTNPSHSAQPTAANNPHLQITTIKLNGANYVRWSQSVRMYIRGRSKIGYITGAATKLKETDPAFVVWDVENSMVMRSEPTTWGIAQQRNYGTMW